VANTKSRYPLASPLFAFVLVAGVASCGDPSSSPIFINNPFANSTQGCNSGSSAPGTSSTGCAPPGGTTGGSTSGSVTLNTSNAAYAASGVAKTTDMLASIGDLLRSTRPQLQDPATDLLTCANALGGGQINRQYDGGTGVLTLEYSNCEPTGGPSYAVTGRMTVQSITTSSTISAIVDLTATSSTTGTFQIWNAAGNSLLAEISITGNMTVDMGATGTDIQLSAAVPFDIGFTGANGSPSVTYTLGPISAANFAYVRSGNGVTVDGTITGIPTDTTVVDLTTTSTLAWTSTAAAPTSGVLDVTAGSDGTSFIMSIGGTASAVAIDIFNSSSNAAGSCNITLSDGTTFVRSINWSDLLATFAGLPQDEAVTCA